VEFEIEPPKAVGGRQALLLASRIPVHHQFRPGFFRVLPGTGAGVPPLAAESSVRPAGGGFILGPDEAVWARSDLVTQAPQGRGERVAKFVHVFQRTGRIRYFAFSTYCETPPLSSGTGFFA